MSQLAAAVNVVERGHLATRSNRLITDLLREEPGILIQQTTAGQGAPFIRALTGSQILLMVDGVRLNNGTFRQGPSQYLATVDPELVQRFVRALARGYQEAAQDPQGAIDILKRHNPEIDEEIDRPGVELIAPLWTEGVPSFGWQTADKWVEFADWMQAQGLLGTDVDANEAFTNRFVEAAR